MTIPQNKESMISNNFQQLISLENNDIQRLQDPDTQINEEFWIWKIKLDVYKKVVPFILTLL
jgi:hypothetical protein